MNIPETVPWCLTGVCLGSGGQGDVHVVTHKNDPKGTKYALKALRYVDSDQARERFQREIKAVKKLTDPEKKSTDSAIIRVVDHSELDDEFQYYIMEYHEGAKTLASIIFSPDNPIHGDVLTSLDLFEQIVSAIRECEASNPPIVHRDIKPDNILVLEDGTIRLIDFGICHFEDGNMITLTDENVGPRNYMAPECGFGNDAPARTYSDLYSAAKVLWSSITSKRVFDREEAVFSDLSMEGVFRNQTEIWHLRRIFEKTIRKCPQHRFQNTREVLWLIGEVRYLIERGYPPLEDARKRCPRCGDFWLIGFPKSHLVFGNSNPEGICAIQCNTCGFIYVQNVNVWQANVDRIRQLS